MLLEDRLCGGRWGGEELGKSVLYVWVQILRLKFGATISGNPFHKISHKYVHSVVHRMYYGIDMFKIFVAWLDLEI